MKQQIITEAKVLAKKVTSADDLKKYDHVKSVVSRTAINPSVNVELGDRSSETQALQPI
ncbi:hypothetical protein ACEQPO_22585 [Bacillus sp. SL00103]